MKCTSTLVLTLTLAIAGAAHAGVNVWTTHGPYGGDIGALAIDPHTPSTLYAGTDADVFDIELTPPACLGDCNNDDHVTIDELLTLVNIALGNGGSCPYGLAAGVTPDVSVILHAVNNALNGCCAPTTCAAQGTTCGTISDGCGGTVSCGTCTTPNTCGGGGRPNVCGCTPATCAAQGAQCGSVPDGCGGTLNCGTCTGSDTCGGGGTPNVCGAPTVSLEAFPAP